MKREDIELHASIAWEKEMSSLLTDASAEEKRKIKKIGVSCFVDGAEWRINSVWHDASEKPENGRYILVDKEYRIQAVWKQYIGDDWLNDVNHFGITRWAYVDDLLPERKEEAK